MKSRCILFSFGCIALFIVPMAHINKLTDGWNSQFKTALIRCRWFEMASYWILDVVVVVVVVSLPISRDRLRILNWTIFHHIPLRSVQFDLILLYFSKEKNFDTFCTWETASLRLPLLGSWLTVVISVDLYQHVICFAWNIVFYKSRIYIFSMR